MCPLQRDVLETAPANYLEQYGGRHGGKGAGTSWLPRDDTCKERNA